MPNVQIGSGSSPYESLIQNASQKYGVPENLIKAVIKQESGGHNDRVSNKGAGGLMQLMPKTAASLGVTNVWDPAQNIDAGTRYLAQAIKTNQSIPLGLAAYNAGQGNVNKAGGKIPNIPETQNYVKSIMAMYGGGNIDLSQISAGGSDSSLSLGGSIVNGIQNIFQTLFTDATRMLLYVILFALMVFFGYKALQGSPPVQAAGSTTKKIVKTAIKVIPK
jgi:Transglycosylase SLT domain